MKKLIITLSFLMAVLFSSAQKNVLFEESTGTWCQWCPSGIYYGDSLTHTYDNVFFIAIHSIDGMKYDEYSNATGLQSAPSANVGRRASGLDVDQWFSAYNTENQINPKATLTVNCTFNDNTNLLTASLTATALENMSGAYRLAAIVVEDGVTGPAPGYDQRNSYSGGNYGFMGGWENQPNPVPAERMAYDHVARYLMGGYDGAENSFPSSLNVGQTASYEFTYTLPDEYDEDYVRVIGILIAPDGTIDNAGRSAYLDGYENAAPIFTSDEKTESFVNLNYLYNIYFHDVDNKDITISAVNLPTWLTLEQYDNKSAALYGVPTTEGDYEVSLQLSDGQRVTTQDFTIEVKAALTGEWQYYGDRAFADGDCAVYDVAFSDGVCYVIAYQDGMIAVYENDGDGWEQLGDLNTATAYSGASIDVASNGDVYVAFSEPDGYSYFGHVKKYDGSSWTEVGDIPDSFEMDLHLDSNDVPYVVCRDANDYTGYVYKYENGSWTALGGGNYASGYTMWAKMKFNSNGVPFVAWADGNMAPFVSKFENGSWSVIGSQVGSHTCYYYLDIEINEDDDVFMTYNNMDTRAIDVFKMNGTTWEQIGDGISGEAATYMDMDIKDGNPVIAYVDLGNGNYLSVKEYNNGEWNYVGQSACSEGAAGYPQVAMNDGIVYVAYTEEDMNGEISMMRYYSVTILYPPTDFSGEVVDGDCVALSWSNPVEGTPLSYNIYRDNVLIDNVVAMTYRDNNLPVGTYRYTLTALYSEGESVAVGPVTVETMLGIEENEINKGFKCYPTIVIDNITIESETGGIIRLIKVNGVIVKEMILGAEKVIIDLKDCGSGMYFVEMNGVVRKVVRE